MAHHLNRARFPEIAEVSAYWHGLYDGTTIPRRADIDPRGIENALSCAFVLERIAPGVARFRLAGTHLSDLMGMEVRGMPMTSFFAPSARREVSLRLEEMFQMPAVAEFSLRGEAGIDRSPLNGRLLLLPLSSDLGDVSRALGCLVTDGKIGRTPRRFEVDTAEVRPLRNQPPRPVEVPSEAGAFAEEPAGFTPAPRPEKGRGPFLRLVKSGDE